MIEALDGVGKTSTSKNFADKIGGTYLPTHTAEYEEFKPRVKQEGVSLESKLLAYLTSNSIRSDYIRDELRQGNDIVMDRFYHSTLAFHYAKSGEEPVEHLDLIERFNIVKPDMTIYLEVDEDERLRRIDERDEQGHIFETDTDFMMEVDDAYRQIVDDEDNAVILEAVGGVDNVVDQAYELSRLGDKL